MINTTRPYVFISYASQDRLLARQLFERLRADGIEAWLDVEELLPGQNWQFEIRKAIENADAIIVCLSSLSVAKEGFVRKELSLALEVADQKPEGTIYLIPARLDDCDVPFSLNKYQWADLFDEVGYERIIQALKFRFKLMSKNEIFEPQKSAEITDTKLTLVTITVERDILEFTDKEKQDFVLAISGIAGVSPNEIRVVRVTEGSVVITLELPDSGAKRLIELYYKNDTEIEKLCIRKITVEVASHENNELPAGTSAQAPASVPATSIIENKEEILKKISIKSAFDRNRYLYQCYPPDGEVVFSIGSHLNVEHDQLVILYKNGRPCDVFHEGQHIISKENIPTLLNECGSIEDGDPLSASFCSFYIGVHVNQKWGTPQPITVNDKEFGLVGFQGWGSYEFCIAAPKIVKQRANSSVDELHNSLRDALLKFLARSFSELISNGTSALQIPNELETLEEMTFPRLRDYSRTIGIDMLRFSIGVMWISEKSKEAINNRYHPVNSSPKIESTTIYDVFISYATGDSEIAHELRSSLESKNIKCFIAEKDIQVAAEWQESIKSALQGSKKVLVVLTPRSINRPWVLLETGAAWALGKPLIPATMMVDVNDLVDPIKRHQARKIETAEQRQALADEISRT